MSRDDPDLALGRGRTALDRARDRPRSTAREVAGRAVKRTVDVVVAGAVVLVTAPLIVVLALAIRMGSPGPGLFRQTRIGRGGRPFTIYKLRTMHLTNDETEHATYVHRLVDGVAEPVDGLYKLCRDPRSTRLGRVLRRTSLDELPQLLNVLKGDMSLVGPRPSTPAEAALWDTRTWGRVAVKPGMTGLWQVSGRSRLDFEEMVTLDLEYAATSGPVRDLGILVRTPWAILRGETA